LIVFELCTAAEVVSVDFDVKEEGATVLAAEEANGVDDLKVVSFQAVTDTAEDWTAVVAAGEGIGNDCLVVVAFRDVTDDGVDWDAKEELVAVVVTKEITDIDWLVVVSCSNMTWRGVGIVLLSGKKGAAEEEAC
jgi:hypothetical protein